MKLTERRDESGSVLPAMTRAKRELNAYRPDLEGSFDIVCKLEFKANTRRTHEGNLFSEESYEVIFVREFRLKIMSNFIFKT